MRIRRVAANLVMSGNRQTEDSDAAAREFLGLSRRQLRQYLGRIESCLDKLPHDQVWAREHDTENSVGNLILHLAGNVRQWIVSGVGDKPDNRDRDAEFDRREPLPVADLLDALRSAVEEADRVMASLSPADLSGTRKIQVYELTVLHAIYHVLWHFAEHTGRIIWATKRATGEDLRFYGYLNKGEEGETAAGHEP